MPISPMIFTVSDLEYVPSVAISKTASGTGMLSQLCVALQSARERNVVEAQPIVIPTLTAPKTLADDTDMKVDDNDVDDDSDTESTISSVSSSRFSDVSSAESMTSVSSSSTSSSKKSAPFAKAQKVYVPPHRLASKAQRFSPRSTTTSDSKLPHQLPSHPTFVVPPPRRTMKAAEVDKTKASVNRYLYQGGETNVVGGGVMLGKAKKRQSSTLPSLPGSASAPLRKDTRRRTDMVMSGPEVNSNWRRTRNVRARV